MKKLLDKPYKTNVNVIVVLLFCLITVNADANLMKMKAPIQETPRIEKQIVITEQEQKEILPVVQPKKTVTLSRGGDAIPKKPTTQREIINGYVKEISVKYKMEPELIMSIIQQESEYNPKAKNGNCLGLMQVSSKWHRDRASKLGVTNFYDPYSNILLGVDYISELITKYKDPRLALMVYNMNQSTAINQYKQGKISSYAKTVLARAEQYKKGDG